MRKAKFSTLEKFQITVACGMGTMASAVLVYSCMSVSAKAELFQSAALAAPMSYSYETEEILTEDGYEGNGADESDIEVCTESYDTGFEENAEGTSDEAANVTENTVTVTPVTSTSREYHGSSEQVQYDKASDAIKEYIREYSIAYGIDEALVRAICYNETRFRPSLTNVNTNGTTDWGIAQCNDTTYSALHKGIGINNMSELLNAETGVKACCYLLNYYSEKVGWQAEELLLAYQEGLGNYWSVKKGWSRAWSSYKKTLSSYNVYAQAIEM